MAAQKKKSASAANKTAPEEYVVTVKRSRRRTLSIEITPQAAVLVRAPYSMPNQDIRRFLQEKSGWIDRHIASARQNLAKRADIEPLSDEELEHLADQALRVIPERVAHFASIMGVSYGRITIRNQRTRWGSCSAKGNLNFNCLLMLAPADVLDYVIVHELAHRKEMNHSKRFWSEVAAVLPDYRDYVAWLKDHGTELMQRMTG